jgi:3-hydroxyisobutyrate dehydrogenase-like beta-hydroxyacid dehydrogenase
MISPDKIGFIGLGVMGEPMCRNLAAKSGAAVIAFDLDPAPLIRLVQQGVKSAKTPREVVDSANIIFLSLPSGDVVKNVACAPDGLLAAVHAGQMIVDLSTSPVDITRELAAQFAERGATFIDAPVARTRAAAEAGTLSITVGADPRTFEQVRPLLATFATEITLCGPVGCGQVVKILNNMVLFETVVALSEAKAIGERAGVEPATLFSALSKGSADSFALRNHGMKAILPGEFPERAFSVSYARKDLTYALSLARDLKVNAGGARNVEGWFSEAIERGLAEQYWPVISQLIGK